MLIKGSNKGLSADQASRSLHMEPRAIEESLKGFSNAGILVLDIEERFKYAPESSLRDSIDETARMYNERRTAVINFIYAAPMRSFSDAFKLTGQD